MIAREEMLSCVGVDILKSMLLLSIMALGWTTLKYQMISTKTKNSKKNIV